LVISQSCHRASLGLTKGSASLRGSQPAGRSTGNLSLDDYTIQKMHDVMKGIIMRNSKTTSDGPVFSAGRPLVTTTTALSALGVLTV
jgi:hypothetical protein